MSLERQVLFWGLGLAALLLIVYLLGSTITPFAAGIVLGYLLDPVVLKLQRFGFNRLGASLLILTIFVLTVVLFFILVVPVLGNQFIAFAQHLPGYAVRLQAFAVAEGNVLVAKYGGRWLETPSGSDNNCRAPKFKNRLATSSRRAPNGFSTPSQSWCLAEPRCSISCRS